MSLLTKPAARVLEELTSLWVTILKSLYFPRGDFLTATRGCQTSWGWSRVLVGRDTIRRERIWRIGNGSSVQIYTYRWINTKWGFRTEAISGHDVNDEARVSDLIEINNQWREDCVRHHVTALDADYILRIPLPMQANPDKLVWPQTKEENSTIPSVYHRLRETGEGGDAATHPNGNRPTTL